MTSANLADMPNPDLVREFAEITKQMGYAELGDDRARYNELYKLLSLVVAELKARRRRDTLLPLLKHESGWVRYHAAQRTLAIAPEESRRVLKEICASKRYPEAGYAGMTLTSLDLGWFVPD